MKSHTRVVVVGGGIVGCSVLYHLTQAGWHDVVLIERGELTCGSTWHAAGLNHLYAQSPFLTRIAKESLDLYQYLERERGYSCGIHITGGVRLTRSKDGIQEFKRYLRPALALGVEAEIIDTHRVMELWPLLDSKNFLAALHTPGEGYVDATMTTNALAKEARLSGAKIYRNTTVTGLSVLPSGEWRVETDQGVVQSEYVVNCGGSWGGEISKLLGHYLPVMTMEHQYLVTEQTSMLDHLQVELPVLRDPSVPFYCRQERQGLMVSGFEHEAKLNWLQEAPADFAMALFPPDLERSQPCLEESFEMVPALKSLGIQTIVNGPIPATPDMQGLLGPAHGYQRYFTCCAIHGGFVQGGLTRYLAQWIVDGEPPIDLSSVDVRRFGTYADHDFAVSRLCATHTMFSLPAMYPAMEPVGGRQARTDSLFEALKNKGAVFGVSNGWEVANWFAPAEVEAIDKPSFERANWFEHVANESRAVRQSAGLINLTALSKFEVSGTHATHLLERLSANLLPEVGCRSICPFLTPLGNVEVVVDIAQSKDGFFVSAPAAAELRLADWLHGHAHEGKTTIRNRTNDYAIIAIAGPASTRALELASNSSLSEVPVGTLVNTAIDNCTAALVRVDDIDATAWRIRIAMSALPRVYSMLMSDGGNDGLVDVGMRAVDSLRIERGLARWGVDFATGIRPADAVLDHLVVIDKGEFIGRDAIKNTHTDPENYCLAMLRLDNEQLPIDPWGDESIELHGTVVGTVTSGAYAHTLAASLAFAQIERSQATIGTQFDVVALGERFGAELITFPHSSRNGYVA